METWRQEDRRHENMETKTWKHRQMERNEGEGNMERREEEREWETGEGARGKRQGGRGVGEGTEG
jgi:hypothetical protein